MVLTSHSKMIDTDSPTGIWLGEFTDPYYEFIDKGYEVTLASPRGGKPPIDPLSLMTENITSTNRRFQDDEIAKQELQKTYRLEEIDASEYDALFYPGGHGPMWDLAFNDASAAMIVDFIASDKPVGAVCHGPAALIKAAELRPNFLKGRKLTAFSNTEEKMTFRIDNIPYKLETRLKDLGAEVELANVPFTSKVVVDGMLITGQNPLSAGPAAVDRPATQGTGQ